jgi:hypothetical protein
MMPGKKITGTTGPILQAIIFSRVSLFGVSTACATVLPSSSSHEGIITGYYSLFRLLTEGDHAIFNRFTRYDRKPLVMSFVGHLSTALPLTSKYCGSNMDQYPGRIIH